MLENPKLVLEIADRHGARDTTQRGTAREELLAATPRSSQDLPGHEVPEKHWMYRLAKRHWFNDFGVYDASRRRPKKDTGGAATVGSAPRGEERRR
jgi:hypothetical protein